MNLQPHPLTGPHIRLEPVTSAHEDELRAALDCDPENWAIQIASAQGAHWPAWWEALVRGQETSTPGMRRQAFAVRVLASGDLAGTSSFLFIDPRHATLEIGSTWFRPEYRGTRVNPEAKRLMLARAFALRPAQDGRTPKGFGAARVAFRVDARNARSRAAMARLGAVEEGVMRHDFVTWTGHRRSSVLFSILAGEWPGVRAGLDARLAAFA